MQQAVKFRIVLDLGTAGVVVRAGIFPGLEAEAAGRHLATQLPVAHVRETPESGLQKVAQPTDPLSIENLNHAVDDQRLDHLFPFQDNLLHSDMRTLAEQDDKAMFAMRELVAQANQDCAVNCPVIFAA